jgi:nitrite reductase/ring-hydroxylating ferredoxin subunit
MTEKNTINVCSLDDLKEKETRKFQVPAGDFPREAFLIRLGDEVRAYYNECAHIPMPLDWDDNDFLSLEGKTLQCKHHGAEYDFKTGECTSGPCVGASLKPLSVKLENSSVIVEY